MTDTNSSDSGDERIVGGTWVWTRKNVLGNYYRYEPRDNIYEAGIDGVAEFFCPAVSEELDAEIARCEAELLQSASWLVFLRNQKLTLGG